MCPIDSMIQGEFKEILILTYFYVKCHLKKILKFYAI